MPVVATCSLIDPAPPPPKPPTPRPPTSISSPARWLTAASRPSLRRRRSARRVARRAASMPSVTTRKNSMMNAMTAGVAVRMGVGRMGGGARDARAAAGGALLYTPHDPTAPAAPAASPGDDSSMLISPSPWWSPPSAIRYTRPTPALGQARRTDAGGSGAPCSRRARPLAAPGGGQREEDEQTVNVSTAALCDRHLARKRTDLAFGQGLLPSGQTACKGKLWYYKVAPAPSGGAVTALWACCSL
jgi:hypothetical protein